MQYIPWFFISVVIVLSVFNGFMLDSRISFRVTSLALGQSYDWPSASEVNLKDMGKIYWYRTTTKRIKMRAVYILPVVIFAWWRHQMETFSALLALWAGNSSVTGELPAQRPVTLSFDVFFELHPNKRLSKQSLGWWFETPSCSLWRHCNAIIITDILYCRFIISTYAFSGSQGRGFQSSLR